MKPPLNPMNHHISMRVLLEYQSIIGTCTNQPLERLPFSGLGSYRWYRCTVPSGTTGRALHQLLASRLTASTVSKNARLALLRGTGGLEMGESLEEMGDLRCTCFILCQDSPGWDGWMDRWMDF